MKQYLLPLLGAALWAASGQALAAPKVANASIPFVSSGSIQDWAADGNRAFYVQDVHRNWYHATLMSPCTDLPFTEAIGFETRGTDTLDRFSSVFVRHQRCALEAFVASGPPPSKAKHHGKTADKGAVTR